jgi:hypothetical protein
MNTQTAQAVEISDAGEKKSMGFLSGELVIMTAIQRYLGHDHDLLLKDYNGGVAACLVDG